MDNPFKIHKSYSIRHEILKYLHNNNGENDQISSQDISKATNIPIEDIHFYHQLLRETKEIDCCEKNEQHHMTLEENGVYAYTRDKYLKEGRAELWDNWYTIIKVVIPLLTVIIALAAYYNSSKTSKLQREQLERQLQQQTPKE